MPEDKPARERIIRERVQLLIRYPFFGYLALGLKLKEVPEVGTMGTDGEHLFYNPAFVEHLDPEVLRMIVAHETLHCALGHLWREETREQERWNHAADYATNIILKKDGFTIPPNCLCDDKFEGMEAEIIYTKIPNASLKGGLLDSHDKWPQGKKNQSRAFDNSLSGENQKNEDLEKLWRERLVRAATAARLQGKLPGTVDRCIQDILQPKLDWRIILRDKITSFAKNNFRLVPPSKRHLWRGIHLPSMDGETLEIAVCIDTSGSVSIKDFQEFLAEARGAVEQFDNHILHLFFCDVAIHERFTLTSGDDWPERFSKRGGGTSFVPVFDAVADDNLPIAALVYLTDGAGTYPKHPPEYPVIWILNRNHEVPWGETIKIEVAR